MAADFLGNGRLQWYAGGTAISKFPESGTIPLPAYTLPQWPPATIQPLAGVSLDADGDGDLDIFRINAWGGMGGFYTMTVFLNDHGSFTQGWRLDFEHDPAFNHGNIQYKLQTGDFDRDGDVDVATLLTYELTNTKSEVQRYEGSLAVRWNDGTGKFATAATLQSTGFRNDATLGVGDFDHDGDIDVICGAQAFMQDNDLWKPASRLFENNGSGSFTASTVNWFWPTTPVDLNRDGWLDLTSQNSVSWNLRPGTVADGFDGPYAWPFANGSVASGSAAFADADGDGHVDVVYGGLNSLILQRGQSTDKWHAAETLAALSSTIFSTGAADGDGDGDMDFLAALQDGSFVFLENQSHHWAADAAPAAEGNAAQYALAGVTRMQAADFNQDGLEDLLAVTPSQNKLWMFYGGQNGVPSAPVFKNTQNTAPGDATVADLDRDGRPDVAYTLPSSGTVRWARNTGIAPLSWTDSVITTGLPGVTLIAAGDHGSANGRLELLTSSAITGQLRWLYPSGNDWLGQSVLDNASPAPQVILPHNVTARPGDEPFYLSSDGTTLRVRGYQLNPGWTGAGDLTLPITASPFSPAMAWGDMNDDGRDELVIVTGGGNVGYWVPSASGTAIFAMGTATSPIRAIETVDWDRDGRTDVLCATAGGLCLFTSKNGWQREDIYNRGGDFTALKVIDLNRDGFPDAAAANATGVVFVKNMPRVLRATAYGPAELTLPAGQSGIAMHVEAAHQGRSAHAGASWLSDVEAAATGVSLQFQRAIQENGQWTPGATLTKTELSQLLIGASLVVDSTVIGSSGPAALEDFGVLPIQYNAVLGKLVPLAGGTTQQLGIRLTPAAGAAQNANSKFFLTVLPLQARVLDGGNTDLVVPVTRGITPRTLITIVPNYTPIQQWRLSHFGNPEGTGLRANDADLDQDGVPNLVEYVTGTDPAAAEPALNHANTLALLPLASPAAPAKIRLIAAHGPLADPHLRLTVQVSTDLKTWGPFATRTGGGSATWTGTPPDMAIPGNGFTTHLFTTPHTPQTTPRLLLRLQAEELP